MTYMSQALRLYARRRIRQLRNTRPCEAQRDTLLRLLQWSADTDFGRAHGFRSIRTIRDFQEAVPVATYEDFWHSWWAAPFPRHLNITSPGLTKLFAESSGTTTGSTKYLPVTERLLASNRRAALDALVFHTINEPESRLLSGKVFLMGATTSLTRLAPGISSGKMSGLSAKTRKLWTNPFAWPSDEITSLQQWSKRIDRVIDGCFSEPITVWGGLPNWMIVLLEQMYKICDDRKPFPHLELLIHSGMAWDIYDARFKDFLIETGAKRLELYTASEGFIAIEDVGSGNGMRLNLSGDIFYEFIPVNELGKKHPTRHWIEDVEVGQDYAIVLTTCAGLFAYILGDIVRFIDREPPRLLVTGRTSQTLSVFGEHLSAEEIDKAVRSAATEQSVTIEEYAVGPILDAQYQGRGRHVYLVSTADKADAMRLASCIDSILLQLNLDYRIHRGDKIGLLVPEVRLVRRGAFLSWMAQKGTIGDQYKMPRVITDHSAFFSMLKDFSKYIEV